MKKEKEHKHRWEKTRRVVVTIWGEPAFYRACLIKGCGVFVVELPRLLKK